MFKRYTFWLTLAAILQLLTAAVHSLSFLVKPNPHDESERQLLDLLQNYQPDLGPYFHPTYGQIYTGLSASFALLFLLGGSMNLYLLSKRLSQEIMKGVTALNTLVFGASFLITLLTAFIFPIIFTGVVFLVLCFAYATNHIHVIKLPED